MNTNLSLEFIIAIVTLIGGLIAIVKFLSDLNTKVTNLETKMTEQITELKIEMADFKTEVRVELVKMQARFDKYDGVHTDIEVRLAEAQKQQTQLKEQITEVKNETSTRINQMETENKNYIKGLTNKMLEVFQSQKPVL